MSESNKQAVVKINQSFVDSDTEGFLAYCAEDVQWNMVGHSLNVGKEAIRKAMAECPPKGAPEFDVRRVIADGDVVMSDGTMKMPQGNGEYYVGAFCDVYRFQEGKVIELNSYIVDLPASGETDAESEIKAALEQGAQAIQDKNAQEALASLAPEIVQFSLAPPLQSSGEDALGAEGIQSWFDTFDGPIGYVITELRITTEGDIAYIHSLNHMTGTKTTGEKVDLWFRNTKGLRKIDGSWKVTHDHESVPFLMDGSEKAALNLKP